MNLVSDIFIFCLGLIFGSFLNVCIHRLPREESIVKPGSHCIHCNTAIAWYDNVPVWSFLVLKGKCRHCSAVISPRYFFVELASGALWLWAWVKYDWSFSFVIAVIFFSILLAVTMTDLETGYIPDKLTLPGMLLGLVLSAFSPELHGEKIWYFGLMKSAVGLVGGGGIILGMALIGNWLFKKDSMGGGDIKLLAMMGAFVGVQKSFFIFFLSPLLALPFALYAKFFKRAEIIPYGPFLALAGVIIYLFGAELIPLIFPNYTYGV